MTFWSFKRKNLKSFFSNFKKENFFEDNLIEKNDFYYKTFEDKEISVKNTIFLYYSIKQNTALIEDKFGDQDIFSKQLLKKYYPNAKKKRLKNLIREYNYVKNYSTDPGLRMGVVSKYKENNISLILENLEKKIKKLEKTPDDIYQKERLTPRKIKRRLWYLAKENMKSKNPKVRQKGLNYLNFLNYAKQKKKERERLNRLDVYSGLFYFYNNLNMYIPYFLSEHYGDKYSNLKDTYRSFFFNLFKIVLGNLKKYFVNSFIKKKKNL